MPQCTMCESCALGGSPRAHAAAALEAARPTVGRRQVPLAKLGCFTARQEPVRRKTRTPEAGVTDDVLHALSTAGLLLSGKAKGPGVRLRRNNQGVATLPGRGKLLYGLGRGTFDFVGRLVPSGIYCELEVKSESGTLTPAQAENLEQVRADGGRAAVVRSGEDAVAIVREWLEAGQ